MIAVGTVLADKYRVDGVLGEGGMGLVVSATHLQLGHSVAIKVLLPELLSNAAVVERFSREARASASLRSEHVCRVSDVGVLSTGAPYIVMELLHGRDLGSLVAGGAALPLAQAVDYVLQACVGVAEAHALGIVHRDLKSPNLFLTHRPDGTPLVKVLDFGIAKAPSEMASHALTKTQTVMGSPSYMSPEQMRSTRDVDARSDLWSLGVILYELVSGGLPFVAESLTALALRIATDPTPLLAPFGLGHLDPLMVRALAKTPAERFQTIAEFAAALVPFGDQNAAGLAAAVERVLRTPAPSQVKTVPATAPHHIPTPTTLSSAVSGYDMQPPNQSRKLLVAVAGVVVVGAIAAVLGVMHATGKPTATTVSPSVAPVVSVDAAPVPDAYLTPDAPPPDVAEPVAATPDAAPPDSASPRPDAAKKPVHKPHTPEEDLGANRH